MEENKTKVKTVILSNDLRLCYDKYCMWIERYVPLTPKGTPQKNPWKRVSGYHRTVTELVQSFEWRELLKIEGAYTIEQLAEAQRNMHEEIRELCKELKTVEQLRK